MKRWFIFGIAAAGMLLNLAPISFAEDRSRGSSEGSLMGPKTPTDYYIFQHGQVPPVLPSSKDSSGGTNQQPSQYSQPDSQPAAPPQTGHWGVRRTWIPEQQQEVWIYGHFENGTWVNGHSEVRVYPGYFEERRVWINGSAR
jgi:hypothetical protein